MTDLVRYDAPKGSVVTGTAREPVKDDRPTLAAARKEAMLRQRFDDLKWEIGLAFKTAVKKAPVVVR